MSIDDNLIKIYEETFKGKIDKDEIETEEVQISIDSILLNGFLLFDPVIPSPDILRKVFPQYLDGILVSDLLVRITPEYFRNALKRVREKFSRNIEKISINLLENFERKVLSELDKDMRKVLSKQKLYFIPPVSMNLFHKIKKEINKDLNKIADELRAYYLHGEIPKSISKRADLVEHFEEQDRKRKLYLSELQLKIMLKASGLKVDSVKKALQQIYNEYPDLAGYISMILLFLNKQKVMTLQELREHWRLMQSRIKERNEHILVLDKFFNSTEKDVFALVQKKIEVVIKRLRLGMLGEPIPINFNVRDAQELVENVMRTVLDPSIADPSINQIRRYIKNALENMFFFIDRTIKTLLEISEAKDKRGALKKARENIKKVKQIASAIKNYDTVDKIKMLEELLDAVRNNDKRKIHEMKLKLLEKKDIKLSKRVLALLKKM